MEFVFSQFRYPISNPTYSPELYIVPWKEGILDILGADYRVFLSPEERARERNFSDDAERNRFITARLLLRCLLSQKSQHPVHPSSWQFRSGPYGKPYLAGPTFAEPNAQRIPQFNLSHSGSYIALAFSECASLGVDIELVKHRRNMRGIARMIFTPDENKVLRGLLLNEEREYFYRLWCRYEARGKLEGGGLSGRFKDQEEFLSAEGNFFYSNNSNSPDLYFWVLCWRIARPKLSGRLPV